MSSCDPLFFLPLRLFHVTLYINSVFVFPFIFGICRRRKKGENRASKKSLADANEYKGRWTKGWAGKKKESGVCTHIQVHIRAETTICIK